MISSLLLALREGLEAALIIGIVTGVLVRLGRPQLRPLVWGGALAAALLAAAAAAGLSWLGMELEGAAEQIFEGLAMLFAAAMLTWMIFWMHRQKNFKSELEAKTRRTASGRGQAGLFALSFLAVFREGLELAVFLLAAQAASTPAQTMIGALLGLTAAAALGWLLFTSTRRLDVRRFFQATNILLVFFAAGLVGYGVHELNEAGWIPAVVEHLYDLTPVLAESSALGGVLKALFGYNANPSLTSALAYLGYFLALALSIPWRRAPARLPQTAD